MTTPTARAAGFSGGLCCVKGQPGPEDVVGCVLVGVSKVTARKAAEHVLADAVSGSGVPAAGAPLGGVTGIDLNDQPSGAFSLGAQHAEEHPPPAPAVAAKYDLDHRVGSQDRRYANSCCSMPEVKPLNWFATCEGEPPG